MPQILRTTLIADQAIAADGEVQFDLPVNPLSCILLTVRALNDAAEPNNYAAYQGLLNMLTNVNVRYRGASIIDASLIDLAVLGAIIGRWQPRLGQQLSDDNFFRFVTVPILFGRRPYDPMQCFPATRRGDLILTLEADIAVVGLDGLVIQAETVELLDAKPRSFLKQTTTERLMTLGSTNHVDLPIGNRLLGLLLRASRIPAGAINNNSFGEVALEIDNVEVAYSRTNWETLAGELHRLVPEGFAQDEHSHRENDAAAYAVDAQTAAAEVGTAPAGNYAYMDFDPLLDLAYSIDTRNAADVTLEVVADAADASPSRIVIVEHVELPETEGAAT
jgi:hypothetical protein